MDKFHEFWNFAICNVEWWIECETKHPKCVLDVIKHWIPVLFSPRKFRNNIRSWQNKNGFTTESIYSDFKLQYLAQILELCHLLTFFLTFLGGLRHLQKRPPTRIEYIKCIQRRGWWCDFFLNAKKNDWKNIDGAVTFEFWCFFGRLPKKCQPRGIRNDTPLQSNT